MNLSKSQYGVAVILIMLVLILSVSTYLLTKLKFSELEYEKQAKTTEALKKAKKALMARMLTLEDGKTPQEIGSLTCPDIMAFDGISDPAGCGGNQEGKLPYRTLDIDDIRDGYGEPLWYSFPVMFDDGEAPVVNTNNIENLVAGSSLTLDGQPVLAVIMAPGEPLDSIQRSGRPSNNIDRYLEGDNSDSNTSFTTGTGLANFNDTVISITHAEMLDAIHQRVIANVHDYLENFYDRLGYYPYPEDADFECQNDAPVSLGTNSLGGSIMIGRIPLSFSTAAGNECIYPAAGGTDSLDPDFLTNNISSIAAWRNDIWYAVSKDCTADVVPGLDNCNDSPAADYLTLDGDRVKYVIMLAGKTPANMLVGNICDGAVNDAGQTVPPIDFCDSLEDYNFAEQNTDADKAFFSNRGLNANRNDIIYGKPIL